MSIVAPLQTSAIKPLSSTNSNRAGSLLQRKCIGAVQSSTDECPECIGKQRFAMQRRMLGNSACGVATQATDASPPSAGHQHATPCANGHSLSHMRIQAPADVQDTSARYTGLPAGLMMGLQYLSGIDLAAVRVHYASTMPSQLGAFAYTHGVDIHVAPGQERHLPHEGWHVVQQMQGRVKPMGQMKGLMLNNSETLEREADVMGARAQALGDHPGGASFKATLGSTSGERLEDEPFAVGVVRAVQLPVRQLARPSPSSIPVVQKAANFVAGTVTSATNLAAHVIAGNRDMGFTPPSLNGTATLSAATAQGAIKHPVLGGRSNAEGTATAWVQTVPTNEASFTMRLPSAPPWSTVTAKANVAALFASLGLAAKAGCSTAGDSTFSFKGKPTDADFAANVRTHEDLHAADHKTGFNDVIVPWDTKLEAAKTAKTKFNGPTAADAEAALYTAMGGNPDQIATAQFNKWIALNNTTHGGATLATGGVATPSNSAANATCTTSSIDAT